MWGRHGGRCLCHRLVGQDFGVFGGVGLRGDAVVGSRRLTARGTVQIQDVWLILFVMTDAKDFKEFWHISGESLVAVRQDPRGTLVRPFAQRESRSLRFPEFRERSPATRQLCHVS